MSIFNQQPIKSRVMKAINEGIARAEKDHAAKCIEIDIEAENKKAEHSDQMVNEIIGKII